MDIREQFDRRIERQRRALNACLHEEWWSWISQFPPLGRDIISAAINHFHRKPFSESDMANHLKMTGQWPNDGAKALTPERTVNTYCCQTNRCGHVFERWGGARFRIKDEYPPEPTGMHDRYFHFRTDPDKERNSLPCGCILIVEPNLAISVIYCDKHRHRIESVEKKKPASV